MARTQSSQLGFAIRGYLDVLARLDHGPFNAIGRLPNSAALRLGIAIFNATPDSPARDRPVVTPYSKRVGTVSESACPVARIAARYPQLVDPIDSLDFVRAGAVTFAHVVADDVRGGRLSSTGSRAEARLFVERLPVGFLLACLDVLYGDVLQRALANARIDSASLRRIVVSPIDSAACIDARTALLALRDRRMNGTGETRRDESGSGPSPAVHLTQVNVGINVDVGILNVHLPSEPRTEEPVDADGGTKSDPIPAPEPVPAAESETETLTADDSSPRRGRPTRIPTDAREEMIWEALTKIGKAATLDQVVEATGIARTTIHDSNAWRRFNRRRREQTAFERAARNSALIDEMVAERSGDLTRECRQPGTRNRSRFGRVNSEPAR